MKRLLTGAAAIFAAVSALSGAAQAIENTATDGSVPLLEAEAAPYIHLRADIAHIEKQKIASKQDTRNAHLRLSSHDPKVMGKAFMAYAALVAADVPSFAAGIEAATSTPEKREAFLAKLASNPAAVRTLPGANDAIAAVQNMAARDATRVANLGATFIETAYATQNASWAKKKLPRNGTLRVNTAADWGAGRSWPAIDARPATVSASGTMRPNLTGDEVWTHDWSTATASPRPLPRSAIMMSRALILAAKYSVGDLSEADFAEYGKSKDVKRCFVSARLNLDQCVAATRTANEEMFCVGTHALNDISRCVGWPVRAGAPKQ